MSQEETYSTNQATNNISTYYAVVYDLPATLDEEQYSVVYSSWMFQNNLGDIFIKYPPLNKVNKYLKQKREPEDTWKENIACIVGKYKTLEKANKKIKRLINYDSESTTTDDPGFTKKRQRKNKGVNKKYSLEDDSDGSNADHHNIGPLPTLTLNGSTGIKEVIIEEAEINVGLLDPLPDSIVSGLAGINEARIGQDLNPLTTEGLAGIEEAEILFDEGCFERCTSSAASASTTSSYAANYTLGVAMFKKIVALEHRQKIIETQLGEILNYLKKSSNTTENVAVNIPNIPINSFDELALLEDQLNDQKTKKVLVNFLKRTLGSNERDCVIKMLPSVFGLELGRTCSLKGRYENKKLDGTNVLSAIKEAVLENYPNIKNETFNAAATDWFKGGELRYRRKMSKQV